MMYNTALRKRQRLEAKTGAILVSPLTEWPAGPKRFEVTVTHTIVKEDTFLVTAVSSVDAATFAKSLMVESETKKIIKSSMSARVSRNFDYLYRDNGADNTKDANDIIRPGGLLSRVMHLGRFFK